METTSGASTVPNEWTKVQPIDYNTLNTDEPTWASNSAVYSFKGDAGDVGEPDVNIEQQLFNNANKTRAGAAMDALDLTVTVEGPDKIKPIRKVSLPRSFE